MRAILAAAISTGVTNWDALVQLHLGLSRIAPTIGVTVGYAAAVGKAHGPNERLETLLFIDAKTRAAFAPAEATRAYLLAGLGNPQEALAAYEQAIFLTTEPPLRRYLQNKRSEFRDRLV